MSSKRRNRHRGKHKRRNKKHHHGHQHDIKHKTFDIGAFICIRKQREGVGIVKKPGDKNSYLIAFKNGKYGWYRSTKINSITEQEYLDASDQFVIDKNLPSPSPTPSATYSHSYTPSPSPIHHNKDNIQNIPSTHEQIKFKPSTPPHTHENAIDHLDEDQDKQFEIKIQDISNEPSVSDEMTDKTASIHTNPPDESNSDHKEDIHDINENECNETKDNDDDEEDNEETEEDNDDDEEDKMINVENEDIEPIVTVIDTKDDQVTKKMYNVENDDKAELNDDIKEKVKKIKKVSKFEKKMKLYYKVKDLRERSFLIMCDENKMIDLKSLYEYIQHFGKIKPSRNRVKQFLDFMKPNGNDFVSFSKFVKAIDDDGDVIAAFKRFKKCGNARSKR